MSWRQASNVVAILLFIGGAPARAADTYYVDSVAGSDGNAGTSSAAPWRSIAKVNSTRFFAGDHILFKRGRTWRELLEPSSSGEAGNPIVIDAYGTGFGLALRNHNCVSTCLLGSRRICRPLAWEGFEQETLCQM